jgi:hypothetical protein
MKCIGNFVVFYIFEGLHRQAHQSGHIIQYFINKLVAGLINDLCTLTFARLCFFSGQPNVSMKHASLSHFFE